MESQLDVVEQYLRRAKEEEVDRLQGDINMLTHWYDYGYFSHSETFHKVGVLLKELNQELATLRQKLTN